MSMREPSDAVIDLSITIPNTNKRDLLRECLRSLYAHTSGLAVEVIVVDNASDDGSVEMVRQEFPQARIVVNQERLGSSQNFNRGLHLSRGRHLAVLHEDTAVTPKMFEELVGFLNDHHQVGLVAPRSICPDGSLDSQARLFPSFWEEVLDGFFGRWVKRGFSYRYAQETGTMPFEPDWIGATCLVLRRQALDMVGLFDERLWIFFEETDLEWRLRKSGWQVYMLPAVSVVHHRGVTAGVGVSPKVRSQFPISRYLFYWKNLGGIALYAVRLLDCVVYSLRLTRWTARQLLPSMRAKSKERVLQYREALSLAARWRPPPLS